ncbi:MAG: hypothetical protein E7294_04050 [Lachnospiraceae bacterium]|jgi:hypothetical protein|nr:hypothetical protein [Lachnospiraceae bacterium]
MNEAYVEQLVQRKTPAGMGAVKILMIVMAVLSCIAGVMITPLAFLTAIAAVAVAIVVHLNSEIEYEYLFVDRELSVDIIRNRSRRKKLANVEISHLEIYAPLSSDRIKGYLDKGMQVTDYSSGMADSDPYAVVYNGKKGMQIMIVEGSDELYKCFCNTAPRKVFKE